MSCTPLPQSGEQSLAPVDETRRNAIARNLCARLSDDRRSVDELRVIDWVLEGLELGAEGYGPLDLQSDVRLWKRERAMEARDLLFYSAAQAIVEHDLHIDLLRAEMDAEIAAPVEAGLTELRDSEPIDMRLRHELTGFDVGGES